MEKRALIRLEGAEALGRAAPLFNGWEETLIQTALQGCMGEVWALEGREEAAAFTSCGDFVSFAGEPDAALVRAYREKFGGRMGILAPQNEAWEALIKAEYGDEAKLNERYAIYKDKDCFDTRRLEALASKPPDGVTLRLIDDELYEKCLENEWSRDFVSQFLSAQDFAARGLGVAALWRGELVGGASSYICYKGGIEIEVDTREDMRRKGIATACSAKLILACLVRGLYPSWDAANRSSVGLAQKLGYREKGMYHAYHVNESM